VCQIHRYLTATTHYARGIAHAVLGDMDAAATDLSLLLRSAPLVPADHVLHNNLCSDMLAVAEHMLRGELHYRLGTHSIMVTTCPLRTCLSARHRVFHCVTTWSNVHVKCSRCYFG
jgi:hypothetical protein